MELSKLKSEFIKLYGMGEIRTFVAPARVNLIGEHTDYNGGYVFPCAIDLRCALLVRKRKDNIINIAATTYPQGASAVVADKTKLGEYKNLSFGSYPLGVMYHMEQEGYTVSGMDMLYDETVPYGSGLSSSAAIEVATALAVDSLSGKSEDEIDLSKLAQICQRAENQYMGMNCGIMDQFASAMGKENCALLLRCSDLAYAYAPVNFEEKGYSLIIANTCKPRSLIVSAYNERRAECQKAVEYIRTKKQIDNLCEITPNEFENLKDCIPDEVILRRATHVIHENARTISAVEVLKSGEIFDFGRLMIDSHMSLKENYEVTGHELDSMVNAMLKYGAIGARMTGAGFGGCAIALVKSSNVESFLNSVFADYIKETNLTPKFYPVLVSQGAHEEK